MSPVAISDMQQVPEYRGLPERVSSAIEDLWSGRTPNRVHAFIRRLDGEVEDLGTSTNLRVNEGNDWQATAMGVRSLTPNAQSTLTSITATTATMTGAGWTTDQWKGYIVAIGNVFGRIQSNTATVLTVDKWENADNTTGTTPGGTSTFCIVPGQSPAVFIALTTNTGAPAAGDTTLTSEISTNGLQRAIATYAHTNDAASYTLTKTFTASGTHTAVHKAGLFTNAANGIMVFETNLNADATLNSGDTLTITWTVNI